jgi:hypothetical protein
MQQKTVSINRGLYLIRYDSAQDTRDPPRGRVFAEPGNDQHVVILSHPDAPDGVLSGPGSMAVVRSMQPAKLVIEVVPTRDNGSVAATIKVEALSQSIGAAGGASATAAAGAGAAPLPKASAVDLQDFKLVGHVAGVGDIAVRADEWLAGPTSPSRVEGFAIEWPGKPPGLEIGYAARIGGPKPVSTNMGNVGSFAGTKGRALPLVAANLELSGPLAPQFELIVETIFLGSPKQRQNGPRLAFSGPTGREPLVGLRVALGRLGQVEREVAPREEAHVPEDIPPPAPKPSSRVRVFRSSTRQRA